MKKMIFAVLVCAVMVTLKLVSPQQVASIPEKASQASDAMCCQTQSEMLSFIKGEDIASAKQLTGNQCCEMIEYILFGIEEAGGSQEDFLSKFSDWKNGI